MTQLTSDKFKKAVTRGKLVLLRHGQTTYNEEQRMAGQRDVPLTPFGVQQAINAGAVIAPFHFDKVFTSTLSRAFNTGSLALGASGTNDHLKKPDGTFEIEQRRELMEANAGDFTGLMLSDPAVRAFDRKHGNALPNGESDTQFIARVQKFYEDEVLPRLERGENVLIVSHAGVMHAMDVVLGLETLGPEGLWGTKTHLPNTAAFVGEFEDGKMVNHYSTGPKPAPNKKNDLRSW